MLRFLTQLTTVTGPVSWHVFLSRSLFLSKIQSAFAFLCATGQSHKQETTALASHLQLGRACPERNPVSAEPMAKLPPHQYRLEFSN